MTQRCTATECRCAGRDPLCPTHGLLSDQSIPEGHRFALPEDVVDDFGERWSLRWYEWVGLVGLGVLGLWGAAFVGGFAVSTTVWLARLGWAVAP